ncbi:tetratricopeptide repeat protein [Flavisolibacter ginsenosidimutans]|uniref:Tetratricopeptide repeat protein n=1 Tax=Flavisolibacter ginsenosidimutans TaxID=661481 RepID=A0A5B8UKM3_9BACT|nr:tetratricopeptide repeat protein [Flavisolibacter ginsenosidimutans]QEC57224.1 tetratricopeptide repeat protein [Flavisolibacter ginsenosidimutans]
MKHLLLSFALFGSVTLFAQSAHETAYSFMKTGDHDNAILVLNKALQNSPNDEQLLQDITLAYYYKKDFTHARDYAKKLVDLDNVDVASYQIAGTVYRALEEAKEADKLYKKALKKYPNSGVLYSEYGELLWSKNDDAAIDQWEKGIQADPSYAGNYYHASSYYFFTKDKVWSLIYGEIFVNMEYLTERAREIKEQLLKAYKEKIFLTSNSDEGKPTSPFAQAVYETYAKQNSLTGKGVTVETLTMIRTRFILDWYAKYASKFPFRLFDYQQQLLRSGMFEAYNQWLFGPIENLAAFEQWTRTNADAYKKFTAFQRGRVFKMPGGQFYGVTKKST